MPAVVDSILNSNVMATRFMSNAKKWKGERLRFPVKVSKNTTFETFSGFDTFSTAATDNMITLDFDPKFSKITVNLPLTEISVNRINETRVLDLIGFSVKSAMMDACDSIGTLFHGTYSSGNNFNGLGNLVDDGTVASTVGGQSRTTYTTLAGTVTASGGTLTLAKLATLHSAVKSGSVKPSAAYTTETVFDLYEQLLQPQEQIVKDVAMMKNGGVGGTGFTALNYRGVPVLSDEKAASGTFTFLDEKYFDWYALPIVDDMEGGSATPIKYKSVDIKGTDQSDVEGLGFSSTNWLTPTNQAAKIMHIYCGGNFVTENPKRSGKLTSITGV